MYSHYKPEFSGKRPASVVIEGETFEVDSWRDVVSKTCEVVRLRHPREFPQILKLKGSKRRWFSRKPMELRDPTRVVGTNIFVETNKSANALVLLSFHILNFFGMEPKIDVRTRD